MLLKIELKMRYVSRKPSKEVIQQAEEVITTSKFGNKFHNIFPLKKISLRKFIECKIYLQKS